MVRTIVITGTSRGLGLEFVRQYASVQNTRVIAVARRPESAHDLQELSNHLRNIHIVKADVANETQIVAAAAEIKQISRGVVDMLINNAGILQTHVALTEVAPDVIDKHFHNDVTGSIMFTNAIFPMMTSSSEKRIIFMSSTMGSLTWNSPEGWGQPWPLGVYSVIKAALHMVARKYATELSEDGFTVVSLSPGWCKTELGTDYAPMYPEDSIRMVIPVIDSLAAKDNGRLVNYDGKDYDF